MIVFFCGFVGVILLVAGFAIKGSRAILSFVAAGFFLLMMVTAYGESTATWDAFYGLFFFGFILVAASVLIGLTGREKKEVDEEDDIDPMDRDLIADMEASEKDKERFDRLSGSRKRKPRKKLSRFARTGKE